jgi:hypothetical protein
MAELRVALREYKRKFGVRYPDLWWETYVEQLYHARRCLAEGKPFTEEEIEAGNKEHEGCVI